MQANEETKTTKTAGELRERASILRRDVATLRELEASAAEEEREAFRLGMPGAQHAANLRERAFRAQLEASEREARELEEQADALEREASKPAEPAPSHKRPRIVRSWEVESYGVEHAQYFRGAGVSLTRWEDVAVGCGNSEREAVEDALEMLAQSGEWSFAPELGFAEPELEDYSEDDEVSQAEADALRGEVGDVPEPVFELVRLPADGCGPIPLGSELGLCDGFERLRELCASFGRDGYEVSRLTDRECDGARELRPESSSEELEAVPTDARDVRVFELCDEDGTGGDFLVFRIQNASERERVAQARESFDEMPSELSFYVALFVSDVPEGEEDGPDGLTRYEDSDGCEWYFAPDSETAESAAREEARRSLWAFSLDFVRYALPEGLREGRAFESLKRSQGELCEDFGPVLEGLLGRKLEDVLSDALRADGAGHFLSQYDGEEVEDSDGALRYRLS